MNMLIHEKIEKYCELHSSAESELLSQLNRETHLKVLRPRMLSGLLQGQLLSLLSNMIKPKYVLEIGTYTGYSALCLATGLQENGELHTIEMEEELEEIIVKYFSKSIHNKQLHLHIGEALNIIPTLDYEWDLIFIDAEKKEYLLYYQMLLPRLKKGGFILVDNVLWSGKVVEKIADNDPETKAIVEFNEFIQKDSRVKNLLLPFRDGLLIIEKL